MCRRNDWNLNVNIEFCYYYRNKQLDSGKKGTLLLGRDQVMNFPTAF